MAISGGLALREQLVLGVAALATFSVALYGTSTLIGQASSLSTTNATDPPLEDWHGRHVLVVLIGSAGCRFSSDPTTRSAFAEIVAAERMQAQGPDSRVMTVGIAVDRDPRVGLDILQQFGGFDEMIVGGGFLNTGAVRYMVRDFAGVVAVPQVLIVSREVRRDGSLLVAGPDSVHRRLVGTDAIAQWASRVTRQEGKR